jgi:hypothetical protein
MSFGRHAWLTCDWIGAERHLCEAEVSGFNAEADLDHLREQARLAGWWLDP